MKKVDILNLLNNEDFTKLSLLLNLTYLPAGTKAVVDDARTAKQRK